MFQRALAGREKALGPNHVSTLNAMDNLGSCYHEQGRLDEAEELLLRALAGYKKTLGKEALNASLLNAVYNLGVLYYHQRKLDEVEQMLERALAGYQEVYGRSHDKTIDASKWLERVRSKIGKFIHPTPTQRSELTTPRSRPRCRITFQSGVLAHRARQHWGSLAARGTRQRLKSVVANLPWYSGNRPVGEERRPSSDNLDLNFEIH